MTREVFKIEDLLEIGKERSWLKGPSFLTKDESTWNFVEVEDLDPKNDEIKQTFIAASTKTDETFITYTKYSNFDKVLRIIAWIQRFINNCKKKQRKTLQY